MKLKAGVFATCVFDCCHSGTILDLPYTFVAGQDQTMKFDPKFDFDPFLDAMQNDSSRLSSVLNYKVKRSTNKKSGFAVELRDDGMFYGKQQMCSGPKT